MNKHVLGLILTFIFGGTLQSQDLIFNNVNQSLINLNPSFAGSNSFIRCQTGYKNYWVQQPSSFTNFYNSYDMFIKPINGGVALNYIHDNQVNGLLKTDIINLTYAQYFYLFDKQLKIVPSIQAGGFVKQLDKNKLYFGYYDSYKTSPWDYITPASKKSNFDVSSGLLINYKDFYFGTSVFHLTQPDEGLYGVSRLPYRLSIHSSYNLKLNEKNLLNFFLRIEKQHYFEYMQVKVNALIQKHIVIGAGASNNNTLDFNLGYRHNYYVITAGYDLWYSGLPHSSMGSWSLNASFNFRNKENRNLTTDFETW